MSVKSVIKEVEKEIEKMRRLPKLPNDYANKIQYLKDWSPLKGCPKCKGDTVNLLFDGAIEDENNLYVYGVCRDCQKDFYNVYKGIGIVDINNDEVEEVGNFEAVFNCVKNDDLDCIKKYIADGGSINVGTGTSLFHEAIVLEKFDIVKYFVEECDVDTNMRTFPTFTHTLECAFDNIDMLRYLVNNGADIHADNMHGISMFHVAVLEGCLDAVKFFIEECNIDVNTPTEYNDTALHLASRYGKLDVVKYLVENGANVNSTNDMSYTPIYSAESLAVVKYLVENGANIDIIFDPGDTVLQIALKMGHNDIAEYLESILGKE